MNVLPKGQVLVLIILPGKLRRKTNKLTNHKTYFLALLAILTRFEWLFFIIPLFGEQIKVVCLFLQH